MSRIEVCSIADDSGLLHEVLGIDISMSFRHKIIMTCLTVRRGSEMLVAIEKSKEPLR